MDGRNASLFLQARRLYLFGNTEVGRPTRPHRIVSFDFAGYQTHKDATALGVLRYVNKKVFEEILRGIIKIHLLVRTKTK